MIRFRASFAALALAALALYPPQKAEAAYGSYLCAPIVSGQAQPRTVGGTLSPVPSGTVYTLNGHGCAFIAQGDIGYFQSQGYIQGQNTFSISVVALTASSTAANSPTLPAGAVITMVVLAETASHSITGGIDLGTTLAGTDIASAVTLSSNSIAVVADSALTRAFGTGAAPAAKQVFITCHTSCNSGSVNATIFYSLF